MARDLITNKTMVIDFKRTKPELIEKQKTTISKIHPQLEALHPETYQSTKIENPSEKKLGQNVKVVVDGNKIILLD